MHGGDRRNLSPAILASNFLVSLLAAISWRIPSFTSLYPTWITAVPAVSCGPVSLHVDADPRRKRVPRSRRPAAPLGAARPALPSSRPHRLLVPPREKELHSAGNCARAAAKLGDTSVYLCRVFLLRILNKLCSVMGWAGSCGSRAVQRAARIWHYRSRSRAERAVAPAEPVCSAHTCETCETPLLQLLPRPVTSPYLLSWPVLARVPRKCAWPDNYTPFWNWANDLP